MKKKHLKPSFHLKTLEKEEQTKTKASRQKEIIRFKQKIEKTKEKINETKSQFFEKFNKFDKL